MHATDGISRTLLMRADEARWPVSTILTGSVVFAIAIGAFLVVRRMAGALTAPLPAGLLAATAAGVCVWALFIYFLVANRWIVLGISLSAMLLAVGCSYPGSRFVDWMAWLPVIGLVSWFPTSMRSKARRDRQSNYTACPVADRDDLASDRQDGEHGEQVLQQLMRIRTADGRDALRGTLAAEFAPGERLAAVYFGFCPPFESLPGVEVHVRDDLEADVKLTQLLHNGAQLDVRLREPAEESLVIMIEFQAVAG
ncbi:MAG TPA: hypothetical protein VHE81_18410 [Lacipirellulaceae bacterium]|nr:hypothetical protein [Lacipirellulaceae bacterium]